MLQKLKVSDSAQGFIPDKPKNLIFWINKINLISI